MMLLTIFGTVASFIINVLLGGWTEDLATLLIFMGIDFVMGLLIAAVWKKSGKSETGSLNSISAWKGLKSPSSTSKAKIQVRNKT